MPLYMSLLNWTDQGIKNVKDSPKRLDAVKKWIKELGGDLKSFYMLQGQHDLMWIVEMPNDEALGKLLLKIGSAGNVRTTTMRAYPEEEYRKIIGGLP
ncbi:MAG: GYD domain-containing protein [Nitrospiraceae bacterium]